jgi:hypothetical protein
VHLPEWVLLLTTDYIQRALGNVSIYVHKRFFGLSLKVLDQQFTICVEHVDESLQYLKMESWGEDLTPWVPFLTLNNGKIRVALQKSQLSTVWEMHMKHFYVFMVQGLPFKVDGQAPDQEIFLELKESLSFSKQICYLFLPYSNFI